MIREKEWVEFFRLLKKTFLYVALLNVYGILFAIYTKNKDKNIFPDTKNIKIDKIFICFIGACLILEGVLTYFMGITDGTNRKEYTYIVEEVTDLQSSSEPYQLKYGNDIIRIYPILYEDSEKYIISYLCQNDSGDYYIDKNHQKTISKINVETYYTDDIFTLLKKLKMDRNAILLRAKY